MAGSGDVVRGKRRRLANELRLLRDLNGISGRELAQRIGMSQSKISRIEAGAMLPSIGEVTAWAEAVDAPGETQQLLERLTEAARTEVETWQDALQGQPHHRQDDIRELEAMASRTRCFQPSILPGLLQTPDYAQRVFMMFKDWVPQIDVPSAVAARMNRQLAFYEDGKEFEFLITDNALLWRPGPAPLLLAQLDRIALMTTKANVSIGIIPLLRVQATTYGIHPFNIIETAEENSSVVVLVETDHAGLTVQAADDVDTYEKRWSALRRMAIFDDDARAYLGELSATVRAIEE